MTLENTILECFYRINLQRVKLPPHVRQQRLQGESSNIKLQNKLIRQYFHFEWLFFLRDKLKLSNSGIFNAEWWYIRSLTKINENTMGTDQFTWWTQKTNQICHNLNCFSINFLKKPALFGYRAPLLASQINTFISHITEKNCWKKPWHKNIRVIRFLDSFWDIH